MTDKLLRNEWIFLYSVEEVLAATLQKVDFHTERLAHWTAERDVREAKLRKDGIDMRAAVRAGLGNATAYHPEPTFDNDLLANFHEADERVTLHTANREAFERWARVLSHEPSGSRAFDLSVYDVEFFGL